MIKNQKSDSEQNNLIKKCKRKGIGEIIRQNTDSINPRVSKTSTKMCYMWQ